MTWRSRERSGRDRELRDERGCRCRRLPAWPTCLIRRRLPDREVTQVSGHREPAIEPLALLVGSILVEVPDTDTDAEFELWIM